MNQKLKNLRVPVPDEPVTEPVDRVEVDPVLVPVVEPEVDPVLVVELL